MAAIFAVERKINDTGSAVKTSRLFNIFLLGVVVDRYVTAGTVWLNGAFSKVARAGQVAGTKTREKFNGKWLQSFRICRVGTGQGRIRGALFVNSL
ncbi:hypothetical protein Pint_20075 [Pistacia integerrima]|uniref:Uncharacterized protein n=1 Tax=Pistacia integerrima TaxID=434235 RepID=A0ACC0XB56_9ROSI|nr:hypothetical protein Pint_20075 [Pistacia integerrima]